jgi:hypothetical protein
MDNFSLRCERHGQEQAFNAIRSGFDAWSINLVGRWELFDNSSLYALSFRKRLEEWANITSHWAGWLAKEQTARRDRFNRN